MKQYLPLGKAYVANCQKRLAAMTESLNTNLASQALPLDDVWLLLVEDQSDTAEILTLILEEAGAEVIAVSSAKEALKAVECFIPDVLISDIQLPDLDGYKLLQRLRDQITAWKLERSMLLPAIALTGYSTPSLERQSNQQATQAGFQKYLLKPVEIDELVQSVVELSQPSSRR
jgi:CheY-like chemotaxis protein